MYILILTLALSGKIDASAMGVGGVATAQFANKESCEVAAELWKKEVRSLRAFDGGYNKGAVNNTKSAICVPMNAIDSK